MKARPHSALPMNLVPPSSWPLSGSERDRPLSLNPHGCSRRPLRIGKAPAPGAEGGFASVVVLILVFVMIALLLGNTRVLEALKRDLQRVEQRQLALPANDAPQPAARTVPAPDTPVADAPAPDAPDSAGSHD